MNLKSKSYKFYKQYNIIQNRIFLLIELAIIVLGIFNKDIKIIMLSFLALILSFYYLVFRVFFKLKLHPIIKIITSFEIFAIIIIGYVFKFIENSYFALFLQMILDGLIFAYCFILFEHSYYMKNKKIIKQRQILKRDYNRFPRIVKVIAASSITITFLMFWIMIKYYIIGITKVDNVISLNIVQQLFLNSIYVIIIAIIYYMVSSYKAAKKEFETKYLIKTKRYLDVVNEIDQKLNDENINSLNIEKQIF